MTALHAPAATDQPPAGRVQALTGAASQTTGIRHGRGIAYAGVDDRGDLHAALAPFDADELARSFGTGGALLIPRLRADRLHGLKTPLRDATRDRVRRDHPDAA